jgi:undecaprenyl-diphosphatase
MAWEFEILNWINDFLHGSDFVNRLVHFFTIFGEGGIVWFGSAIVFLFIKKYRRLGITVILAMILIAGFNNYIFKPLVARDRPFLEAEGAGLLTFVNDIFKPVFVIGSKEIWGVPDSYSFMSGHSVSGLLAGTIIFMADRRRFWPFLVLGFLMGLSRLFLVVHYPTDILAGFAFGGLMGVGVHFLSEWLGKKIKIASERKALAKQKD